MNDKNLAILVVSCDRYSDLWPAFIELFYKFWPNCPYQLYIGSNNTRCDDTRVKSICIGEDKSWTDNVRKMLNEINSDHVLMLLEDFFFEDTVNNKDIRDLLQYAIDNNVDCLRLCPLPAPTKKLDSVFDIGEIKRRIVFVRCQQSGKRSHCCRFFMKDIVHGILKKRTVKKQKKQDLN